MESPNKAEVVVELFLPPSWTEMEDWQRKVLEGLALECYVAIIIRKENFFPDLFIYHTLRQIWMAREELVKNSLTPGLSSETKDEIADTVNLLTIRAEALAGLMAASLKVKFDFGSGRLFNPVSINISKALTEMGIKLGDTKPAKIMTIERAREIRRRGFSEKDKGLKK